MRSDRALLELASKAMGMKITHPLQYDPYYPEECRPEAKDPSLLIYRVGIWCPLKSHSDAMKLEIQLKLNASFDRTADGWQMVGMTNGRLNVLSFDKCRLRAATMAAAACAVAWRFRPSMPEYERGRKLLEKEE